MSKTDFKSVREGRHYLRSTLSVVATFVYVAHDSNEEDPQVVDLFDTGQKIVEILSGGEGKTKADQVLALTEASDLFKQAAAKFEGEVHKVLAGLGESAGALAEYASNRNFETHQAEKAVEREKALAEQKAALEALFGAGALEDLESAEATPAADDSEVDPDDPDTWK